MSSLEKLRWFNLAGATAFAVYGWKLGVIPILTVNIAIAAINVFYLFRMYRRSDYFENLVMSPRGKYLVSFLKYYADDIRKWYPAFSGELDDDSVVILTLRNMAVAGVFAATPDDNGELRVTLDFVVPQHADRRVGRHLYQESTSWFLKNGVNRLTVEKTRIRNSHYFQAMGFRQDPGDPDVLALGLAG